MKTYIEQLLNAPWLVIDVESVGLHGEGFAVAGGIYRNYVKTVQVGPTEDEFCFACEPEAAQGTVDDLLWIQENVPYSLYQNPTHDAPRQVREAFWRIWTQAKAKHPEIKIAGECIWPVEARFLAQCVEDDRAVRNWDGPYPFHDVASFLAAADMDPLATYPRTSAERPAHHPLNDARQSARLLFDALRRLNKRGES